jgi:hypothetical protein
MKYQFNLLTEVYFKTNQGEEPGFWLVMLHTLDGWSALTTLSLRKKFRYMLGSGQSKTQN